MARHVSVRICTAKLSPQNQGKRACPNPTGLKISSSRSTPLSVSGYNFLKQCGSPHNSSRLDFKFSAIPFIQHRLNPQHNVLGNTAVFFPKEAQHVFPRIAQTPVHANESCLWEGADPGMKLRVMSMPFSFGCLV